ncbi:MAG TPA: SRPBCC family protein [Candidatus Acidoferrales bacterium]|nr:SRPBCC family protein [Candidatus Acidoferrales bacterium]
MSDSRFYYIIYIRTSIEKLWDALTLPDFTRAYWCETTQVSNWTPGSEWKMLAPDGRVADSGEVLEFERPKRLALKWRHEIAQDLKAEGYSKCVIELEPAGDAVKLTLTHSNDVPDSKFIAAISQGWPAILSSLKSLLETGEALEITKHWPKGM